MEKDSTLVWIVPKGAATDDYILFRVSVNNGLLYGCKVREMSATKSYADVR